MHPIHSITYEPKAPHFRQRQKKPHLPPPAFTQVAEINHAPVRALSLIQPWGWLMANGHKLDENRTRRWDSIINTFILLHAAERMRKGDYQNCQSFLESRDIHTTLPKPDTLERGGYIAIAYVEFAGNTDRYRFNNVEPDKFFTGPIGYRLTCRPIKFSPACGMHGLWRPALPIAEWQEIISCWK